MSYLEDALMNAKPLREHEDKLTFNPSMLWSLFSCERRAYFDWTDPLDDGRDWQLTADHGNAIHEMLVDRIKRAGIWAGDEVRGSNEEIGISYRIDALIRDPENNGMVVPVEIKSTGINWKGQLLFDQYTAEPNNSHVLQLMTYLGCHQPAPYEYGYILYYDKCKDRIMFIRIDYDIELMMEISEKVKVHHYRVRLGEIPEMCKSVGECKYCPYKARCER